MLRGFDAAKARAGKLKCHSEDKKGVLNNSEKVVPLVRLSNCN